MKNAGLLIAFCAVGLLASRGASSQNASPAPDVAPYTMTMGDLMNTFIQPRHAKLGLAGHAHNWRLAAYALLELKEALTSIAKSKPRFSGMPVGELVDAALKTPFAAIDTAIKGQDSDKFAVAYAQLTDGCNACHATLDHPYVVIKVPDASAFPNQDFSPRQ
ncbi:MAG TPA: hypothetical protein VH206_03615 [Xanthobacteraceae bacterium]|jgi:hypothetical protein|nr:hypothetical protein [Xanthobacteraceae bacterium]